MKSGLLQEGRQLGGLVAAEWSHGFSEVVAWGWDYLCSTCGQLGPNDPGSSASAALWPPSFLWGLTMLWWGEGAGCRLLGGQIRGVGVGGSLEWGLRLPFGMLDLPGGLLASARAPSFWKRRRLLLSSQSHPGCLTQAVRLNVCTHKRGKFSLTELIQNFSIRKTEIKSQRCLS